MSGRASPVRSSKFGEASTRSTTLESAENGGMQRDHKGRVSIEPSAMAQQSKAGRRRPDVRRHHGMHVPARVLPRFPCAKVQASRWAAVEAAIPAVEHFPAKCAAVRRRKCDQIKKAGAGPDSAGTGTAREVRT